MSKRAIERAVKAAGDHATLAAAIKAHVSAISHWRTERRKVPARFCLAIEHATHGKVTRYELRPDVFGIAERKAG